jgi:hypothetical protein
VVVLVVVGALLVDFFELFVDAAVVSVVGFLVFAFDPAADFGLVVVVFTFAPVAFGAGAFGPCCVFTVGVVGFDTVGGFGFEPPFPRWADACCAERTRPAHATTIRVRFMRLSSQRDRRVQNRLRRKSHTLVLWGARARKALTRCDLAGSAVSETRV